MQMHYMPVDDATLRARRTERILLILLLIQLASATTFTVVLITYLQSVERSALSTLFNGFGGTVLSLILCLWILCSTILAMHGAFARSTVHLIAAFVMHVLSATSVIAAAASLLIYFETVCPLLTLGSESRPMLIKVYCGVEDEDDVELKAPRPLPPPISRV